MPSVFTSTHKESDKAHREISFVSLPFQQGRNTFRKGTAKLKYSSNSRRLVPPSVALLLCVLATVFLVLKCFMTSGRRQRLSISSNWELRFLSEDFPKVCQDPAEDEAFEESAVAGASAADVAEEKALESVIEKVEKAFALLDLSPEEELVLSRFQNSMVQGAARVMNDLIEKGLQQAEVLENLNAALNLTEQLFEEESQAIGPLGAPTTELLGLRKDLRELRGNIKEVEEALNKAEELLLAMLVEESKGSEEETKKKDGKAAAVAATEEEGERQKSVAGARAAAAVAFAKKVHEVMQHGPKTVAGEEAAATFEEKHIPLSMRWILTFLGMSRSSKSRKKVSSAAGAEGGTDLPEVPFVATRARSASAPHQHKRGPRSVHVPEGLEAEGTGASGGFRATITSAESGCSTPPPFSKSTSVASGSGGGSERPRGRRGRLRSSESSGAPPSTSPPAVPLVVVTPLPPRLVISEEEVTEQVQALRDVCASMMSLQVKADNVTLKDLEQVFRDAVHLHSEAERVILGSSVDQKVRENFDVAKKFTWFALESVFNLIAPVWASRAEDHLATVKIAQKALKEKRKVVASWAASSAKEALLQGMEKCNEDLKKAKIVHRNMEILFYMYPPARRRLMHLFMKSRKNIDQAHAQVVEAAMDCACLAESLLKKRIEDSEKRMRKEKMRLVWFAFNEGKDILERLRQLVDPLPVFNLELLLDETKKMLKDMEGNVEDTEAGSQQEVQ